MNNTDLEPEGDSLEKPISVDIIMESFKWRELDIDLHSYFLELTNIVITQVAPSLLKSNLEIAVLLADDKKLQQLNENFRHIDKSTNVLSFPYYEFYHGKFMESERIPANLFLGDMAFSFDTIYNESIELSISIIDHVAHMFIHSLLHLIGFTHDNESEAKVMEDLEIKILKQLSIKNPYGELNE